MKQNLMAICGARKAVFVTCSGLLHALQERTFDSTGFTGAGEHSFPCPRYPMRGQGRGGGERERELADTFLANVKNKIRLVSWGSEVPIS